jgi:hypothetical protein
MDEAEVSALNFLQPLCKYSLAGSSGFSFKLFGFLLSDVFFPATKKRMIRILDSLICL